MGWEAPVCWSKYATHTHTSIFFVKMGVREGAFYYTFQEKQAIISLQEMAEFLKLICLLCDYICLKI